MLACNWSMATRAASAHAAVRPGQLLGGPLKLRRSVLHLPRGARQRRHRLRDVGEARAQILADQLRHHLRPDAIAYVLRQLDNPVFQLVCREDVSVTRPNRRAWRPYGQLATDY